MTSRYDDAYRRMAADILSQYQAQIPFAAFLKDWFKKNPKAGSRDRREIARRCYGWFRLGQFQIQPSKKRLELAEQVDTICRQPAGDTNHVLQLLYTNPELIFPASEQVTEAINTQAFFRTHFCQPNFFIRVRPLHVATAEHVLAEHGIGYEKLSPFTLRLNAGTPIPTALIPNLHYVVQDWASQQAGFLLSNWLKGKELSVTRMYDCCAASGGKTILMHDVLAPKQIFSSDIRPSIIRNLRTRLNQSGIKNVTGFVHDFTQPAPAGMHKSFDLLIADVPCSGSGTWARTPEQLVFFPPQKIEHYTSLQQQILDNAAGTLKHGGFLYYITCSVYSAENEAQVQLLEKKGWKLHWQHYAEGTGYGADTMFMALLQKA